MSLTPSSWGRIPILPVRLLRRPLVERATSGASRENTPKGLHTHSPGLPGLPGYPGSRPTSFESTLKGLHQRTTDEQRPCGTLSGFTSRALAATQDTPACAGEPWALNVKRFQRPSLQNSRGGRGWTNGKPRRASLSRYLSNLACAMLESRDPPGLRCGPTLFASVPAPATLARSALPLSLSPPLLVSPSSHNGATDLQLGGAP